MDIIVKEALDNYEIQMPQIEFIRHNENATYKVKDTLSNKQYIIRVHKPSDDFSLEIFGSKDRAIDLRISEMTILTAISEGTDIPVQIPIRNKNNEYVTVLSDGTPVTLITWVEGKTVEEIEITNDVLFRIGEMVGQFHRFSKTWSPATSLHRHSYDEKLLKDMKSKIKRGIELNFISNNQFKIIEDAINEVINRIEMLDLLEGSKGIIHSDLSKSNLIMSNGRIVPIDFSLCGYSYYYMDLGSLFGHFGDKEHRQCIINGYKSIINEDVEIRFIEAFMVYQVLLFIATHIEAPNEEWFYEVLDRWSKEIFIPFSNKEAFISL